MERRCRSTAPGALGACVAVLAIGLGLPAGGDAAGAVSVGVVDFYAPSPLPVIGAVIPERAAADELSALLETGGAGRVTVVPRDAIARAEQGMRWRETDALSFARLADLARAAGADRLVVGWIPTLDVEGPDLQPFNPDGNGMPVAQVSVVVQLFDAAQGRIVAQTTHSASAVGVVPAILLRDVLRGALAPTVPWLVAQLVPASLRSAPFCCQ